MADLIRLDRLRARRSGPVIRLAGRHYRVVRPELAHLIAWWRELPDPPARFRCRLDDRPTAAVVVLRSNTR